MSIYESFNFPKTIHSVQCKSTCYPKNIPIHNYLIGRDNIFPEDMCRVSNIEDDYQKCSNEKKVNIPDSPLNYIYVDEFDSKMLLKHVYDINSFEEAILFTYENVNILSEKTIIRIHDCAWLTFGTDFEKLSDIVIDYYHGLTKAWKIQISFDDFKKFLSKYYLMTPLWSAPESHYENIKRELIQMMNQQ